jgi:hypothetical protein
MIRETKFSLADVNPSRGGATAASDSSHLLWAELTPACVARAARRANANRQLDFIAIRFKNFELGCNLR